VSERQPGRVARFFKRHPGAKTTAKRLAIVGLAAGGVTLAALRQGKLAKRELALSRDLLNKQRLVRWAGHTRGIDSIRTAVRASVRRGKGHQARILRIRRRQKWAALPAGVWATYPAVEAHENWKTTQDRHPPPIVVRRRRH